MAYMIHHYPSTEGSLHPNSEVHAVIFNLSHSVAQVVASPWAPGSSVPGVPEEGDSRSRAPTCAHGGGGGSRHSGSGRSGGAESVLHNTPFHKVRDPK
ncbi:hypothetical protein D4764_13G0005780 [Takifugu flavidus]|uniref:Uncharacterized protein n=1 Tax=Takifugu flavidus TaxID=433684 RepID=A0A5C6P9P1_9TELE|nr:hypothetical protein D4764_13G0005780 [Takifugu flavidus]